MLLRWTKDLTVEIDELDDHHKHMIGLVNTLYDAVTENKDRTAVAGVLAELADYANYHFCAEEAMFETKHFPDAQAHIEHHMEFRQHLRELQDLYESGDESAGSKLMEFLFPWWTNHIMQFDKKYVPYLKSD